MTTPAPPTPVIGTRPASPGRALLRTATVAGDGSVGVIIAPTGVHDFVIDWQLPAPSAKAS